MVKRIVSLLLIGALSVSLVSCKKDDAKTSVARKETQDYKDFKIEQTTVTESDTFSENGVSVSVLGLAFEDYVTKIKLHVKNDTDDVLRITTANLSVNGLMCTESYFAQVEAKTEQDAFIEISNSWLGKMGVSTIAELEFMVKVFDSLYNEILTSDILKVTTDAPSSYKQKYDAKGVVIYEKEGVRLVARSLAKSAHSDDYELEFYVENNQDTTISIASKDVTVNKKELDALFVVSVLPGKKCVDTMVFYADDLKDANIKNISSVSAVFQAFDENFAPVFETERISIPVQK